jgi:DNA-binding protein Fis
LENVVHYALIVNSDGLLTANDLHLRGVTLAQNGYAAPKVQVTTQKPAAPLVSGFSNLDSANTLAQLATVFERLYEEGGEDLYGRIEKVLIDSAYAYCQRNQVHTADLLGISRNVLRTQLKRFGLLAGAQVLTNQTEDMNDTIDCQGLSARSIATV